MGVGLDRDASGRLSSRLGTGYKPNEDTGYRLSPDSTVLDSGKSTRGLTLGTDQRLTSTTTLSAGTSLSMAGDYRRNSKDAKLSHQLSDDREVYGAVSHYSNEDKSSLDDGHEFSLGGDIARGWTAFLKLGQGDLHRPNGVLDAAKTYLLVLATGE